MSEREGRFHRLGATLPAWEWRRLLELAKENDIACGGHCRARFDAISFWASPDDLPDDPGWTRVEFDSDPLGYPRAHVGVVFRDPPTMPNSVRRATRVIQSFAANDASVRSPGAEVPPIEGRVRLRWVVRPFRKAERMLGYPFFGATIYQGVKVTAEDFATEADLAWCREKFDRLRRHVRR